MSVMKKLRIILIVIVFCLVMINILKNNIDPSLSGLALSNIEALAGEECTTHWSCWFNLDTRACCNSGSIGCAPCD